MTLIEVVQRSKQYVRAGNGRPDREVEEWVAFCLNMRRFDLYISHDQPMEERELQKIKEGLIALRRGEPLAYLIQEAPFWKDMFYVTKGVLIPRPETESIVERALEMIRAHSFSKVVDVCTGTGCIGLSIKREIPTLCMTLVDLYEEPLRVARKNASKLDLAVRFCRGNLLEPIAYQEAEFLIANPPYLSQEEWNTLSPSVRQFEPKEALLGGKTGIELYEQLIKQAVDKGVKAVLFEIAPSQGSAVSSLLQKAGAVSIDLFCDLFGRQRGICADFAHRVKSSDTIK